MLPGRSTVSIFLLAGFLYAGAGRDAFAQAQRGSFNEAFALISTNLSGVTTAELDKIALTALVDALSPKVRWVGATESNLTGSPAITKTGFHDGDIGYVRVARIQKDFSEQLKNACEGLLKTNKLQGLVMDLRYAQGDSYEPVVQAANLFIGSEKPLLDWGDGMRASTPAKRFNLPVAVLVNRETAGAAEALAAVFRTSGIGLLLGAPTAGRAGVYQQFELSNGSKLLIARKPLKLGDGKELPMAGVKPDIQIMVNPETEKLFYADAFSVPPMFESVDTGGTVAASTNRARRYRISEADLVRERKEGFDPDTMGANEPDKPVVRDPALARALDVLKGLAVVRQARPDFRN